eukprot:scaffold9412_cov263-Amphora_coffeaeformis.AAC.3
MRDDNLQVQQNSHGMGKQNPTNHGTSIGQGGSKCTVPNGENTQNTQHFRMAVITFVVWIEQVLDSQRVQVKAGQRHERQEHIMLVAHNGLAHFGQHETPVVISGPIWLGNHLFRDCQQRHVLDIRVIFDRVWDDMVCIMISFPPRRG